MILFIYYLKIHINNIHVFRSSIFIKTNVFRLYLPVNNTNWKTFVIFFSNLIFNDTKKLHFKYIFTYYIMGNKIDDNIPRWWNNYTGTNIPTYLYILQLDESSILRLKQWRQVFSLKFAVDLTTRQKNERKEKQVLFIDQQETLQYCYQTPVVRDRKPPAIMFR